MVLASALAPPLLVARYLLVSLQPRSSWSQRG